MFFATTRAGVTPARLPGRVTCSVRLRGRAHEAAPQTQSDPEGGIPSGSLEVTWEVGRSVVRSQSRNWFSELSVGDHTDLRGVLGAAIDHLFAHDHRTGIALGAGRDVLGGQRGQGADGAERDNEEAEGRLQHVRSPVRRWCCVVDDRYRARVFPADVVDCFICFVAGNLWLRTDPAFAPDVYLTIEITDVYAARLSTPAPLSRSASCLRA